MIEPALTLRWILTLWDSARAQGCMGLRPAAMHALWCIIRCRTGELGGRALECAEHGTEIVPNSCRRRECPGCVGNQSYRWAGMVEARLLDCDHFHVVFTIPHKLLPYWRHNRRRMADILFDAASESLLGLLDDPENMGGTPAALGVLHTHGSALVLHPHVHLLVSAAGLDADDKLVYTSRPESLLPYVELRRKFQVAFLRRFQAFSKTKHFYLPKRTKGVVLRRLISELSRIKGRRWNVMIFLRRDPKPVVRYLSRTVYGGPIRDTRIRRVGPHSVTFLYQHHSDRDEDAGLSPPNRETTLSLDTFVERWSEHVPEPRQKTVRYWGLLAVRSEHRLDKAREQLGQRPSPAVPEPTEGDATDPAVPCPKCGVPMSVRLVPPAPPEFSPRARATIEVRGSPDIRRAA